MKRIWLMAAALTAVALLGVSAASADSSWTDPAGDAKGGAPDITAAAVSNDEAGTITMAVTVPMVQETFMFVFMDTNMNGKDDDATDRAIGTIGVAPGLVIPVAFDGGGNPTSIPSLRAVATATTVTFTFAKADVGVGDGFALWLATMTNAQLEGDTYGDEMPDGNFMHLYMLTKPTPPPVTPVTPVTPTQPVKPVIGAPAKAPMVPVAGKRFVITFPVTRSDSGAPLLAGKMICDPSVKGKVIQHAESFTAGKARMAFLVPKAAKGQLLKIKVTIKAGTQSATKAVSYRVK
jgi:hypothetical protein